MSFDINLLTKTRGHSFEDISRLLDESDIVFNVCKEAIPGGKKEPYFRDSRLEIAESDQREVFDTLTFPKVFRGNDFFYYALYEPTPEFSFGNYDGKLTFRDGKLVERTIISFQRRLYSWHG